MALTPGDKLGHFEILSLIGKGGMGEVYRARDPRLNRDVAIKVSRDQFSERFEREARAVAALNHPNVCTLYDVGPNFLVMEFVEGEDLAGPLPLDTALNYARQIAEAIEAAHEKGIVHRDLKPANIKVTPAGSIKVLDFGLAKALEEDSPAAPGPDSPTLSMAMTRAGMILGTAAYMSPEQAKGKRADRRADIWAFGVVLYEMLVGKQVFTGDTAAETLASVLKEPISFDRLPAGTPPALRTLLNRCMERDLRKRLQAIGEARIILENPDVGQVPDLPPPQVVPARPSKLPWALAAVATVIALALAYLHFREATPAEHVLRYTIAAPENSSVHSFAVSPDGRMVVIAATVSGKSQLWLRPLDALEAQRMPTTEEARYPFWSPDSRYIAFFAQGKLKKIAAAGGPAQSLCDSTDARGGSWSRDDVIVFSPSGSVDNTIQRVPAVGGVLSEVIKTRTRYLFPVFLPDSRHFLYEAAGISAEKNGVFLASLDGKENRRILLDASSAVFAPSSPQSRAGHLLFLRGTSLMAQPFDVGSFETSGDVFPITDGLALANGNNYAPVTASENGVVLYWSGGTGGTGGANQLVWFDRAGKLLSTVGSPGSVHMPSISPDEKTIAFVRQTAGTGADIWLRDLARGTDRRFTSDPSLNGTPFWSPKGDRVVFLSNRGGHTRDLYQKATNGSGQDEPLLSTPNPKDVDQWSRDGRFIVYSEDDPKTSGDLWVLPVSEGGDRKPTVFLHTEFREIQGQLSPPDSRWMAYTSNVSGQREVYVRAFPAGDNEQRISIAGGEQPRWKGDGKELFYLAADGKIMSVAVKASAGPKPSFEAGTPLALFDGHLVGTNITYFNYDVTADGKRFLVDTTGSVANASNSSAVPPLTVLVNWNAGEKK
jgi:Tol biopolymer transport system component/tRNA A-37 threonylcarbamoyl transferase component Bud32